MDIPDNHPLLNPHSRMQLAHPNSVNFSDTCNFLTGFKDSYNQQLISLCDYQQHTNLNVSRDDIMLFCPLNGCMFSAGALRGVAYTWLMDNIKKKWQELTFNIV
jgi:hypothetical protein